MSGRGGFGGVTEGVGRSEGGCCGVRVVSSDIPKAGWVCRAVQSGVEEVEPALPPFLPLPTSSTQSTRATTVTVPRQLHDTSICNLHRSSCLPSRSPSRVRLDGFRALPATSRQLLILSLDQDILETTNNLFHRFQPARPRLRRLIRLFPPFPLLDRPLPRRKPLIPPSEHVTALSVSIEMLLR